MVKIRVILEKPIVFGYWLLFLAAFLFVGSCSNNPSTTTEPTQVSPTGSSISHSSSSATENTTSMPSEVIGAFIGNQASYIMKRKDGTSMIINGNPVSVPSYTMNFKIATNGTVQFIQETQSGERVVYNGTLKVLENTNNIIQIQCDVKSSDGNSNPTYILNFDKANNSITCSNNSEPIISLQRMDGNISSQSNSNHTIETNTIQSIDGVYTYADNSASLRISISGDFWRGKTMTISGLGADNDNQNAEYESGLVKGTSLYDASGLVEIGHVSGKYLATTIGSNSITLVKN